MGKLDDMRRLREQQFAEGRKRQITPVAAEPASAAKKAREAAPAREADTAESTPEPTTTAAKKTRAVAAPAPTPAAAKKARADEEPAQPTRPTRPEKGKKTTSAKSGGEVDEQGKCSVCGKMKPLSNGVLAQHQKGFGKACGGSRKPPA